MRDCADYTGWASNGLVTNRMASYLSTQ